MKRRDLIKRNQELYSWLWFYRNSKEQLMVSRYNNMYDERDSRIYEDKINSNRCFSEIQKNQELLNKFNKN